MANEKNNVIRAEELRCPCLRRGRVIVELKDDEADLLFGSIRMLVLMGHIRANRATEIVKLLRLEEQAAGII